MTVTHRGIVGQVNEQYKMSPEESDSFIKKYEAKLQLSKEQQERWNGKKYIGIYEILHLEEIEPFKYNREKNMDDWIITDNIDTIKL